MEPGLMQFERLEQLPVRHGFVTRVGGVEVTGERGEVLERLRPFYERAVESLGFRFDELVRAEQVHGDAVAVLGPGTAPREPIRGVDGLITNVPGRLMGIHVADCCAVYLVDPIRHAVGLVHAGRRGTELRVVPAAIATMAEEFGVEAADLIVQLSPCIRPPDYEVDFAASIVAQCEAAGVRRDRIHDCGLSTAADPARFYSYRLEKGRTGRMLALLALQPHRLP